MSMSETIHPEASNKPTSAHKAPSRSQRTQDPGFIHVVGLLGFVGWGVVGWGHSY